MSVRDSAGVSCRLLLLFLLFAWASILSVETWFRRGGFSNQWGLPKQLVRQGVPYLRQLSVGIDRPLPDGMVVLEAADYVPARSARPGGVIRLRRVSLTRSSQAVTLPVERIGTELLGPGGRGRCVLLDQNGTVLAEIPTREAMDIWWKAHPPGLKDRMFWLAGIRPYRANSCLWESIP